MLLVGNSSLMAALGVGDARTLRPQWGATGHLMFLFNKGVHAWAGHIIVRKKLFY